MFGLTYDWISTHFEDVILMGLISFTILNIIFPLGKQHLIYRIISGAAGLIYVAAVLYVTLGMRTPGQDYTYELSVFWSYRAANAGYVWLLWENMANVLMFVPLGLFLRDFAGEKLHWYGCMLLALLLSVGVELAQLIFKLGLCELDDVIHNTLGALIGYVIAWVMQKLAWKVAAILSHK